PYAEIFPLMEGDAFAALVEDVRKHGLRDPVTFTHDGKRVVDGLNLISALMELGRRPSPDEMMALEEDLSDDGILAFVLSANLHRRHLNTGQLAMIALAIEEIEARLAKKRQLAGVKPKDDLKVNLPE